MWGQAVRHVLSPCASVRQFKLGEVTIECAGRDDHLATATSSVG